MPAIDRLRLATREIHERLHHNPAFAPLMQTPPDTAGYARLLGQLQGFHGPAETALFGAAARLLPELTDLAERRKAHLLAEDRAALAPFHPQASAMPAVMAPPDACSRPAVLGGLYVIEGATLGGRDLGRRLEPALQALGLAGRRGRAFFLAYEPDQGTMWRRFCAALEVASASFSPAELATMLDAACDMFRLFETWLARSQTGVFAAA